MIQGTEPHNPELECSDDPGMQQRRVMIIQEGLLNMALHGRLN